MNDKYPQINTILGGVTTSTHYLLYLRTMKPQAWLKSDKIKKGMLTHSSGPESILKQPIFCPNSTSKNVVCVIWAYANNDFWY